MNGLYDHLPLIIGRIRGQIADFSVVDALSVIQEDDEVLANLPGCWVAPAAGTSDDAKTFGIHSEDYQGYHLIIACKSITENGIYAEVTLGELALLVIRAFKDFVFSGGGTLELMTPLEAVGYEDGYIFQRLRFGVTQIIE